MLYYNILHYIILLRLYIQVLAVLMHIGDVFSLCGEKDPQSCLVVLSLSLFRLLHLSTCVHAHTHTHTLSLSLST